MHIWATCTTTLSYTQYFSGSSANFLIGISKVYHKGPTSQPNLDSATTYHHSFLLRKRQDCVFRCDYVSTLSLWTSFWKLNLISLLSHIQILKVSHEYLTPVSADRKNSRWNGIPIYNRGVQFFKVHFGSEEPSWGRWIRTTVCSSQSAVPYRLAIPQDKSQDMRKVDIQSTL